MEPIQAARNPEPRVVHEIRIGSVMAVVRSTPGNAGQPELTVVLRRVDSGIHRTGVETVLSRDELLLAARSLDQAHEFICKSESPHDSSS